MEQGPPPKPAYELGIHRSVQRIEAVRLKSIRQPAEVSDGVRVLVDRTWPRGLTEDDAVLDEWLAEIAPSDELSRWYAQRPERFEEFVGRYRTELGVAERAEASRRLRQLARTGRLTVLTGTTDLQHSHATVLVETLRRGG